MKPLTELAEVIRTKNAGPYELTIDVIFRDRESYEHVKKRNLLNPGLIAELYRIPVEDVLKAVYFDAARAFKATIKRQLPCGALGERDIYGAQQHAPLLNLMLPWGDEDDSAS